MRKVSVFRPSRSATVPPFRYFFTCRFMLIALMPNARTVGACIQHPEFELFDLENDPHEGNNLAQEPKHAELLERMKAKLKEFQKRTNDPWIMKWDYE